MGNNAVAESDSHLACVLGSNAAGFLCPNYFILKDQALIEENRSLMMGLTPSTEAVITKNGSIVGGNNKDGDVNAMKHFWEFIEKKYGPIAGVDAGKVLYHMMDQHSTHSDLDSVKIAKELSHHVTLLSSQSTHHDQVNDTKYINGAVQAKRRDEISRLKRAGMTIDYNLLMRATQNAIASITPMDIFAVYEEVGFQYSGFNNSIIGLEDEDIAKALEKRKKDFALADK